MSGNADDEHEFKWTLGGDHGRERMDGESDQLEK